MKHKKSQIGTMDLMGSMIIVGALMFIVLGIVSMLNFRPAEDFDQQLLFRNLKTNLKADPTYNGKNINFMEEAKLNLTRFAVFGNISKTDIGRFNDYFFKNFDSTHSYDICMFIFNRTNDFVEIENNIFSYGFVSNSSEYDPANLIPCNKMIVHGSEPCMRYDKSIVMTVPVYVRKQYNSLYFVFCRD